VIKQKTINNSSSQGMLKYGLVISGPRKYKFKVNCGAMYGYTNI
jgi:hypothetical protein